MEVEKNQSFFFFIFFFFLRGDNFEFASELSDEEFLCFFLCFLDFLWCFLPIATFTFSFYAFLGGKMKMIVNYPKKKMTISPFFYAWLNTCLPIRTVRLPKYP